MTQPATPPAESFSAIKLFLEADIVVQITMVGLLIASVMTWAIIVSHWLKLRKATRGSERYEREFWKAEDVDKFHENNRGIDAPSARVVHSGLGEWRRSTRGTVDRDGTRARLATVMGATIAAEIDRLSDRLNILATVGSVAPFVGLFGTVWGIMQSLTAFSNQTFSIAVVAPKLAEALFATAVGLFAAIPAVIAYNRFGHGLNRLEARLNRFADGFHAMLSRELELDR